MADVRIEIPSGPAGTSETLRIMKAVSARSAHTLAVNMFARRIDRTPRGVDAWLRLNWIPKPDPVNVEWIKLPEWRIIHGDWAGDCDDAAVFAAALLQCPRPVFGWSAKLCAIRLPGDPEYSHVWLRCLDIASGQAVDLDPIVPPDALPISGYSDLMELPLF